MRSIRLKAVLAVSVWALAVSAGAGDAPSQAKGQKAGAQAIETLFFQYRDALLEGDGAKAADVMSARTIGFYDGVLKHVLNTPRAKLANLDFMTKFMVLRIRHEFTKAEISRMTGRDLFMIGVDKGWISKSSVASFRELADIKVGSSEASASVPAAGGLPLFHFVKESGQWKLDLVASFELGRMAMNQEIAKSGLTEEQFIIRALGVLSSKKVDEEQIFSPPL